MMKLFARSQRDKLHRLLSVMLPILGTQLANIGMNFFDASMSGQAGNADLAGAAIGGNIWMPIQTGFYGILMAATPLMAHLLGAEQRDKIKIIVRHGLVLAVVFALLIAVAGVLGLPTLLHHMQLEPMVEQVASGYLGGIGLGLLPFFMLAALRGLVDTLGYTQLSMRIYLVALPINALLNYILIFGKLGLPAMGGIGAGIATGITYWLLLGMFCLVTVRLPVFRSYAIWGQVTLAAATFKEYLKIGIPMGVAIFMETSIFGVVALFVAKFGTAVIAGHQAALNFSSLIYMIPLSFSLALTIVVGVEVGAKRWQAARDYTHISLQLSMLSAIFYIFLVYLFCNQIAGVYSSNAEVIALTVHFTMYAIMWQFFDAIAAPIQGILRGYKDVNATFFTGMLAYWGICLPLGLYLDYKLQHGPFSYWQSLVFGIFCSALLLGLRLLWIQRRAK